MSLSSTQENPLLGTWKLIAASAIHADGTITPEVYGVNPIGYLTYTPDGHMVVMFSKSDRPLLSKPVRSPLSREMDAVPIAELAAAFRSFSAYAGTYTIHGNIVTHHLEVASLPNRVGTDLVRTFAVNENRITLTTTPIERNETIQFELLWERVNPALSVAKSRSQSDSQQNSD
jgi:Lipocalin-like domain